jgi:hypothetical protein
MKLKGTSKSFSVRFISSEPQTKASFESRCAGFLRSPLNFLPNPRLGMRSKRQIGFYALMVSERRSLAAITVLLVMTIRPALYQLSVLDPSRSFMSFGREDVKRLHSLATRFMPSRKGAIMRACFSSVCSRCRMISATCLEIFRRLHRYYGPLRHPNAPGLRAAASRSAGAAGCASDRRRPALAPASQSAGSSRT